MVYYFVEIAQEMPEERTDPDAPFWEALVEIPDNVENSLGNVSRQLHAREIARTAIGRLRSANDPDFKPHARRAWQVFFDGIRERYPETDFTFPHFVTDDRCQVWFLRKPHSEV